MKTVVGLFDDMLQAKSAALDLERAGIPQDDISLVANNEGEKHTANVAPSGTTATEHAIGRDAVVGAEIGGVAGLILGLTAFAIPGLGWIAGAGWLMGMIYGAGVGAVAGGLIGALTHVGVPAEDAAHYYEGVRRGGTLLAIKSQDDMANRAADLLSRAGAVNIDERAAQYEQPVSLPAPSPYSQPASVRMYDHAHQSLPGIQTGGRDIDGSPDTRGISEKTADAVTGDRIDDKTGKAVL